MHVSVCHVPQKNTANEFLKHSKESGGVLGQAGKQAGKQVGERAFRGHSFLAGGVGAKRRENNLLFYRRKK